MKLTEKMSLLCKAMVILLGCVTLCTCGDDDPVPPTLTITPNSLHFTGEANITRTVNITTDADWSINIQNVPWLTIDYASGSKNATVNFTTKMPNEENAAITGKIIVQATNSAGTKTEYIDVEQASIYPENLTVNIDTIMILPYGFAARINCGGNTKYFKYHVYKDSEFTPMDGDKSKIEEAAHSWDRVDPEIGGETVIINDKCEPGTNYVLAMIPYTSNGQRGPLSKTPIDPKRIEGQPEAKIQEVTLKDGMYQWEVVKNGYCNSYITYACAASSEFTSFTNSKEQSDANRRGIALAWALFKEKTFDSQTHENIGSINTEAKNKHDKFYEAMENNSPNSMVAETNDKYLEIITVGQKGNDFGLLYDVIYRVNNGTLEPVAARDSEAMKFEQSWTLLVNNEENTNISFDNKGGSKTVVITTNDSWTATSSASSWCTVSPTSGDNTTGNVTIKATENKTGTSRSATIQIKGQKSGKTAKIIVTQEAQVEYYVTVSPTSTTIDSNGGEKSITVSSNDSWTVSSSASWCTVSPKDGSKNGSFTITATKNTSKSPRYATITVQGNSSGKTAKVNVTQNGIDSEIDPNATISMDVVCTFTDGIAMTWNLGSTANDFDFIVFTKSGAEKITDDDEMFNEIYDDGNGYSVANFSNNMFKNTDDEWFTANTEYYVCAAARNSSGVRGPVLRYKFKTNATSLPIAEISNVKAETTTKWSFDVALKNNAKKYYLATNTTQDTFEDDWHWYAFKSYYWIKTGQMEDTYDWEGVTITLNSGKCDKLTVCTWALNSSGTIGNPSVAYGSVNASRPMGVRANTTTRGKAMLPKEKMEKMMKDFKVYRLNKE